MPPYIHARDAAPREHWDGSWKVDLSIEGFIIEAWSQGFLVGALVIMAGTTIANMKGESLLHKLILLELFLAMFHGTFCFMNFKGYDWYLSSTAALLYMSLCLHNVIAWMKTKPFLKPWQSKVYIFTFLLTLPYWILESYANFTFFNDINRLFKHTRPFEALCRDPWWIFTVVNLMYNMKKRYNFNIIGLVKVSPRFGVMLGSMVLSIVFVIVDIVFASASFGGLAGINPYWKFSLVAKCYCDTIILDDFRTALERIRTAYFNNVREYSEKLEGSNGGSDGSGRQRRPSNLPSSHASANAISKPHPPAHSHSKRVPVKERSMSLNGLLGDQVLPDGEKSDRIYVNTDIVVDRNELRFQEPHRK